MQPTEELSLFHEEQGTSASKKSQTVPTDWRWKAATLGTGSLTVRFPSAKMSLRTISSPPVPGSPTLPYSVWRRWGPVVLYSLTSPWWYFLRVHITRNDVINIVSCRLSRVLKEKRQMSPSLGILHQSHTGGRIPAQVKWKKMCTGILPAGHCALGLVERARRRRFGTAETARPTESSAGKIVPT